MAINLINARPSQGDLPRYLWDSQVFAHSQDLTAATANTDNPLVLLKNDLGSGKYIYLYHIGGGCAVANVAFTFKLFANPTITANGTAQTPRTMLIGGSATSGMSLFSLPTASSNGNQVMSSVTGQNSNSVVPLDTIGCLIAPGGIVMLTGSPSSNNRMATVNLRWVEM